ncbi:MAG: hypothetical protein LBE91_17730 [Tannerella sp.]|jgi:hypothetical protein|nr:hypothetical protein [Tannerella sp.]
MNRILSFAVCLFLFTSVTAQEPLHIQGKIVGEEDDDPAVNVLVSLEKKQTKKIVRFTQTDADGYFKMDSPDSLSLYQLRIAGMNYKSQFIDLKEYTGYLTVKLSSDAIPLREVVVKPLKIRQSGDTVTYSVSAFADRQDKTIGDVLAKMPGIDVSKAGEIRYNGVSINKFYIEGSDLLEERYGLATNSVSQQDVQSVEVWENHQPIRALQTVSISDRAAINLRLKDGAKSHWVGTVETGAGADTSFLWNAGVSAMRFAPKFQSLNTYKTNNTGQDISRELTDFSIEDFFNSRENRDDLADYIKIETSTVPALEEERSLFNESNILTTNDLLKLTRDYDLKVQAGYIHNCLSSDRMTENTYFFADSAQMIEENENIHSTTDELLLKFVLTANREKYYLKNTLQTDLQWNGAEGIITGTYPVSQTANMPYQKFSNDFQLLKRIGKSTVSFSSFNQLLSKNQSLQVIRQGNEQQQNLELSSFYSNTAASYALAVFGFNLSLKGGINFLYRTMESDLQGVPDGLFPIENNLAHDYARIYFTPQAEYKSSLLELRFNVPVSVYHYRDNNLLIDSRTGANKLSAAPNLYVRLLLTAQLSAYVSAGINQKALNDNDFYEGWIMGDYRSLSTGTLNYAQVSGKNFSAGLTFRNPVYGFFSNIGADYLVNNYPYGRKQDFRDEYVLSSFDAVNGYSSRVWMFNGNISKMLDFLQSVLSFSSTSLTVNSRLNRNGAELPFTTTNWTSTLKWNVKPINRLNVAYKASYILDRMEMGSIGEKQQIAQFRQSVSVNLMPDKKWTLGVAAEHYLNEITENVSRQTVMLDAHLSWQPSSRWELSGLIANILNRKIYAYTLYDPLTVTLRGYAIRPGYFLLKLYYKF